MTTNALRELRRQIAQHYNLEELRLLASDLNVDWDELAGTEKSAKIQGLIGYLGRHGRLHELIDLLRREHPQVLWPDPPPTDSQLADGFANPVARTVGIIVLVPDFTNPYQI